MQALQNKEARTIAKVTFNDADHSKLLRDLGWLDVRNLLELDRGIFMCKCQNKLMLDSITNLFRTVDSVHSYQTRAAESGNLYIPKSLHSSAQKSFSSKGAKVWIEIPCEIQDSGTIHSFKEKRREHYMKMQCND